MTKSIGVSVRSGDRRTKSIGVKMKSNAKWYTIVAWFIQIRGCRYKGHAVIRAPSPTKFEIIFEHYDAWRRI